MVWQAHHALMVDAAQVDAHEPKADGDVLVGHELQKVVAVALLIDAQNDGRQVRAQHIATSHHVWEVRLQTGVVQVLHVLRRTTVCLKASMFVDVSHGPQSRVEPSRLSWLSFSGELCIRAGAQADGGIAVRSRSRQGLQHTQAQVSCRSEHGCGPRSARACSAV